MAEPQSDYPTRIADFLEDIAARIRSMTVDRVANAVTWTAVGIVLATMAFLIVFWLLIGLFRAVGELIGQEAAYAITGVLLILLGIVLWSIRFAKGTNEQE